MRLTLNLPDGLLEEVMQISGSASKTETIVAALRAQAASLRQARLRALRGRAPLLQPRPAPPKPREPVG